MTLCERKCSLCASVCVEFSPYFWILVPAPPANAPHPRPTLSWFSSVMTLSHPSPSTLHPCVYVRPSPLPIYVSPFSLLRDLLYTSLPSPLDIPTPW